MLTLEDKPWYRLSLHDIQLTSKSFSGLRSLRNCWHPIFQFKPFIVMNLELQVKMLEHSTTTQSSVGWGSQRKHRAPENLGPPWEVRLLTHTLASSIPCQGPNEEADDDAKPLLTNSSWADAHELTNYSLTSAFNFLKNDLCFFMFSNCFSGVLLWFLK